MMSNEPKMGMMGSDPKTGGMMGMSDPKVIGGL